MRKCGAWAAVAAMMSCAGAALADPREQVQFGGIVSDGPLGNAANPVQNHTFTGGYPVGRIRFTGVLTSLAPATYESESRIQITAPGGVQFIVQPFTTAATYSTVSVNDLVVDLSIPVADAAGQWTFRFFESFDDGGVGTPDAQWDDVTIVLDDTLPPPPPPPPHRDIGSIGVGGAINETESFGAGEVKWLKVTLTSPIRRNDNTFLDFDTHGSSVGGGTDTEMALYSDRGSLVGEDDDGGDGLWSAMSYGRGSRTSPGGAAWIGQDGDFLPAGVYYIALAGYNATFGNGFSVTTTSTASGSFSVNLRSGTQSPPAAIDLGVLGEATPLPVNDGVLNAQSIVWHTFEIAEDADAARGKYFDIHTDGSSLSGGDFPDDTIIVIYNANGDFLVGDDDDGNAYTSELTFGSGSGQVIGDGLPLDGRDGRLNAGRYYLGVFAWGPGYGVGRDWAAITPSLHAGTFDINIISNLGGGTPACPVDYDGDGFLDFFDFDLFVSCFETNVCPPGKSSDFNDDGFTDFFDYDQYVIAFELGC